MKLSKASEQWTLAPHRERLISGGGADRDKKRVHAAPFIPASCQPTVKNADTLSPCRTQPRRAKCADHRPTSLPFISCFDLCAQGTALDGAQLEIIEIPGLGRCREYGEELAMADFLARCACGSVDAARFLSTKKRWQVE
ncbi:MAG: hypothetical protein ACREYF_03010 [Gammaproteobacteria bacterium]